MIPRTRRGVAALEFALWLPVLFLLVSIVVDWGTFMTRRVSVARASMDAARFGASVFESSIVTAGSLAVPRAEQRAKDALAGIGVPCNEGPGCVITVEYCPADGATRCDSATGARTPVDALYVQIDLAYNAWFGWSFTPNRIRTEFVMAMENQR